MSKIDRFRMGDRPKGARVVEVDLKQKNQLNQAADQILDEMDDKFVDETEVVKCIGQWWMHNKSDFGCLRDVNDDNDEKCIESILSMMVWSRNDGHPYSISQAAECCENAAYRFITR